MPSQNELEIILNLTDNASEGFKKANKEAISQINQLKAKTNETGKSVQQNFKDAGSQIRSFRQTLLPVTALIAGITLTTKAWADKNKETKDAFERLSESTKTLSQQIGSVFAPTIIELSNVIKESTEFLVEFFEKAREGYRKTAETITYATQFWVAFFASIKAGEDITNATTISMRVASKAASEIGEKFSRAFEQNIKSTDEANKSIKEFATEQKDLQTLFIGGEITASQYYASVLEGQNSVIAQNQILANDLQNLAALQAQLSNEELTNARNKIDEQVSLLRFYEQTVQTANQGMASFMAQAGQTIQTGLSGAITDLITGVKSAKEAFKEFGMAMVTTIVNFIAQKIVASVIEKTLLAGTVAAASVAGASVAAAWAPAAALASLASFGGNAGPAAAGIASVSALAQAVAIPRAFGGDDVVTRPTLFLAGEGNRAERVTVSPQGGRNFHGGGDINIYIANATMDSAMGVSSTAEMLGLKIEDSLRRGRSF